MRILLDSGLNLIIEGTHISDFDIVSNKKLLIQGGINW